MGWYSSPSNTRHILPNAFVGWDTEVNFAPADTCWKYRKQWISTLSEGGTGVSLQDALDLARNTSGWWNVTDISLHRRIYGASEMTFRQ